VRDFEAVVLAVVGTALDGAAAVDAYLAARLPVAAGLLVLAQAGPGQAVALARPCCWPASTAWPGPAASPATISWAWPRAFSDHAGSYPAAAK
jgi:hypothetical protein